MLQVPLIMCLSIENQFWMTVSAGLAGSVVFFLILICCCCCTRSSRNSGGGGSSKKSKKSSRSSTKSVGGSTLGGRNGSLQELEMNSLLRGGKNNPKAPEVPLQHLQFFQELGEGAFGKVYKGEAILPGESGRAQPVAIKALKASATPKTKTDFFREADLMAELRHANIVCLLGVVTKSEPHCMLFEYMSQGDLHEFLMTHSPRAEATSDFVLEPNEMLYIATQIAAGMEYLGGHHYVHR